MKLISDLILHKDHQIVVANKPAGLPCTSSKGQTEDLQSQLRKYLKSDLHLIHRIDQPVTGICVFAKTKNATARLSEEWKEGRVEKVYLGVTRGNPKAIEGIHEHFILKLNRINKSVIVEEESEKAKKARLEINFVDRTEHLALMKVNLLTGRHHQIRTQLAHLGYPIRGDVKYGDKRGNRDQSINLHAFSLKFTHPGTKKSVKFICPAPDGPPWKYFKQISE